MLSVFLLGGGLLGGWMISPAGVDRIEAGIELAVEDSARAAKAGQIIDELENEVKDFDRIFIASGASMRELYLDHGAGSHKTLRNLETLNLEWYASQNRVVKLRTRLRETITAEEWAKVFEISDEY